MKQIRKLVSLLLCIALLLSVTVSSVYAETTQASTQKVYYGKNTYKSELVESNLADYYSFDESTNTYTRNSAGTSVEWDRGFPFLWVGNQSDFTMDFDFSFKANGAGKQYFSFVVGSQQNSIGWENGSAAELVRIGVEQVFDAENPTVKDLKMAAFSYNKDGTERHGVYWSSYTNYFDATKKLHLEVIVSGIGMKLKVSQNGNFLHTFERTLSPEYVGGLIGLAANETGMTLSNIVVTPADETTPVYAYYGSRNGAKVPYPVESLYTVTTNDSGNKVYTRNGTKADGQGWDNNATIPFGKHNEFKLEFTGKYDGTASQYFVVTLGSKWPGSGITDKGALILMLGYDGGKTNWLTEAYDGSKWITDSGDFMYLSAKSKVDISTDEEHIFTITVKDSLLTIDIDDGKLSVSRYVNALYDALTDGGYVSIGSNRANTYFTDVAIEDYSKTVYSETQAHLVKASSMNNDAYKNASTYYTITETAKGLESYKRNSTSANGDMYNNYAMLTVGNYKDFRLEFDMDVSAINDPQNAYTWINVGNQRRGGVRSAYGSAWFCVQYDTKGFFQCEDSGGVWFDNYSTSSGPYRGGRYFSDKSSNKRHFTVTVSNGLITVESGNTCLSYALNSKYIGGYITIGLNKKDVILSDITVEDLSKVSNPFTTYFSSDVGAYAAFTTDATSGNLTYKTIDADWSFDGNSLFYKKSSMPNNYNKNYSVAYYNVSPYNEFELNFEFRAEYGIATVGFGATIGKSWFTDKKNPSERKWQPDAGNYTLWLNQGGFAQYGPIATYIDGSDPDSWYFDSYLNESGTIFNNAQENAMFHHAKLHVEDGRAFLWIDNNYQGNMVLDRYNGGYIYFAANVTGTAYRNIDIRDISASEPGSFEGFSSYYSSDITKNALSVADANDYWTIDGNTITRKIVNGAVDDKTEWAELFLNTGKYENFDLEVDVTNGLDGWQCAYVGFGAEMGKHLREAEGGIATLIYPDSSKEHALVNLCGNLWNAQGYDYQWKSKDENAAYNKNASNHLRIVVQDRLVSIYLNNVSTPSSQWVMPEWYYNNGGYIFLGSNSSYAAFSNLTVNGISAIQTKESILNNKSALFVGDSVCVGPADVSMAYGYGGRIGRENGMYWVNQGQNGSTFATDADGVSTIMNQMESYATTDFDYVIIQGAINDVLKELPLGTRNASYNSEDFDEDTFIGAFEKTLSYAVTTWPNAHIGYVVTYRNSAVTTDATDKYYQAAKAICQKWHVPYLDLNGEAVYDVLSSGTGSYFADDFNLNAEGLEELTASYIEPWMNNLPTWGGLEGYARCDFDNDGVTGATDLAEFKTILLEGFITDLSAPDISCEYADLNIDVNGDACCNILDLISLKKIIVGLQ